MKLDEYQGLTIEELIEILDETWDSMSEKEKLLASVIKKLAGWLEAHEDDVNHIFVGNTMNATNA